MSTLTYEDIVRVMREAGPPLPRLAIHVSTFTPRGQAYKINVREFAIRPHDPEELLVVHPNDLLELMPGLTPGDLRRMAECGPIMWEDLPWPT